MIRSATNRARHARRDSEDRRRRCALLECAAPSALCRRRAAEGATRSIRRQPQRRRSGALQCVADGRLDSAFRLQVSARGVGDHAAMAPPDGVRRGPQPSTSACDVPHGLVGPRGRCDRSRERHAAEAVGVAWWWRSAHGHTRGHRPSGEDTARAPAVPARTDRWHNGTARANPDQEEVHLIPNGAEVDLFPSFEAMEKQSYKRRLGLDGKFVALYDTRRQTTRAPDVVALRTPRRRFPAPCPAAGRTF